MTFFCEPYIVLKIENPSAFIFIDNHCEWNLNIDMDSILSKIIESFIDLRKIVWLGRCPDVGFDTDSL